jgi:hypothetical protein
MIQYLLAGDLVHIKKFAKDASSRIEYIGYATPGSAETDPVWFIKKLSYDAGGFQQDELFADGNASFDKLWTLRASYSYS